VKANELYCIRQMSYTGCNS